MVVKFLNTLVAVSTFFVLVELKPVEENPTIQPDDSGQGRAGITDLLKPPNLLNQNNNSNQAGSPLGGLPNPLDVLGNGDSGSQSPLKDVKLFLLTVQGAIIPASVLTSGFTGFLQGLGNAGNMFGSIGQAAQNLNPLSPNKN